MVAVIGYPLLDDLLIVMLVGVVLVSIFTWVPSVAFSITSSLAVTTPMLEREATRLATRECVPA